MSLIAVNELEARTGTEVSVVAGETFAVDGIRTDSFQARTSGNAVPVAGAVVHPPVVLAASGTINIDFASGNTFKTTLTGDPTFTFTNLAEGGFYVIHLNPNGSARNLTWPVSGTKFFDAATNKHSLIKVQAKNDIFAENLAGEIMSKTALMKHSCTTITYGM